INMTIDLSARRKNVPQYLKETITDEYSLKYFEDYGSIKFIEIIGIDHCVGFLSFRPPYRKTEINCIIDDDDIDF
ncbi:4093_t:CDS:2, partial [Entrophospora sp. SA101]